MTATQEAVQAPAAIGARRNEKVGQVVSTKMQKTIVVEVEMRKAHPKYKRIVRSTKKFYAHDEQRDVYKRQGFGAALRLQGNQGKGLGPPQR